MDRLDSGYQHKPEPDGESPANPPRSQPKVFEAETDGFIVSYATKTFSAAMIFHDHEKAREVYLDIRRYLEEMSINGGCAVTTNCLEVEHACGVECGVECVRPLDASDGFEVSITFPYGYHQPKNITGAKEI